MNQKIFNFFVLFLLFILILKTFNNKEKLTNDNITSKISELYKADVSAIRNLSKLANNLTKDGKLVVPGGLEVKGQLNLLPKGCILAWNNNTAPEGWAICDGSNGTPDLRGRFILAAGNGNGLTNRTINQKGGEETHKLTIDEMPSHNHSMNDAGKHFHAYADAYFAESIIKGNKFPGSKTGVDHDNSLIERSINTGVSGNHKHTINTTGKDIAHNNMPPFYVLTYIMKL